MSNKDEALRLAREALLKSVAVGGFDSHPALAAIEEALAQQEQESEPVFLVWDDKADGWLPYTKEDYDETVAERRWLLYTAPPSVERSEMRDLTDEEIKMYADKAHGSCHVDDITFARAIIAAMKGE